MGPAQQRGGDSAFEMRLAGRVTAEAVKDSTVRGPTRKAYHVLVPASWATRLWAPARNAATSSSSSFPGFAFKLTDRATFS